MNFVDAKPPANSTAAIIRWVESFDAMNDGKRFREKINHVIAASSTTLIIDLTGASTMGSREIGNLVATKYLCDEHHVKLLIHNMPSQVSHLLTSLSMISVFDRSESGA